MNKKENPYVSLFFNLIAPICLLNYGHKWFAQTSPLFFTLLALSFPVGYGLWDYFKHNQRKNMLSIFGSVNVLFTGGFAFFTLEGIWFAVKEAAFPLLIGLWCLATVFTKTSVIHWFVNQSSLFQVSAIQSQLTTEEKKQAYNKILQRSTLYISLCFFFSAVLNFVLALRIFQKSSLQGIAQQQQLNEQIADMTWISFFVIGLPLTLVSGGVLWWLISQLRKLTSLTTEQLIYLNK